MPIARITTQVVKVRDELPRIIKDYKWWDNAYVAVGWDAYSGKYPDGTLVAQVALFNEFGTYNEDRSVRSSARPFMRPAYQQNKPALDALRTQVVRQVNEGKLTPEKGLNKLGYNFMAWVRAKILANPGPALRPRTLARKRREGKPAVTLIDTRRMLDSLTYKIYLGRFFAKAQTTQQAQQASATARQITGDTAAKQAAKGQALRAKVMTAKQVKREKKVLREELRRAKASAKREEKRQVKRFRASAKRDKKRAASAERRQQRRFRASVKKDKAKATQKERAQKKRFERSRARDKKRAAHVRVVARRKAIMMARRDRRQAKGLPRVQHLTQKQKEAKLARARLVASNNARLRAEKRAETREIREEKRTAQSAQDKQRTAKKRAATKAKRAQKEGKAAKLRAQKTVRRSLNRFLSEMEDKFT